MVFLQDVAGKEKQEPVTNASSSGFKVDLGASAREGTGGFRQRMCSDLPFTTSARRPGRNLGGQFGECRADTEGRGL